MGWLRDGIVGWLGFSSWPSSLVTRRGRLSIKDGDESPAFRSCHYEPIRSNAIRRKHARAMHLQGKSYSWVSSVVSSCLDRRQLRRDLVRRIDAGELAVDKLVAADRDRIAGVGVDSCPVFSVQFSVFRKKARRRPRYAPHSWSSPRQPRTRLRGAGFKIKGAVAKGVDAAVAWRPSR
jgi:hypothetical protein